MQSVMQEKIGKVTLDYLFYPGQDLYSDGPVEEMLLEIARNVREDQLNRVIAERQNWPVLYHFSHLRWNILDWLPLGKEDNVLEIGSGCGAVTGVLARKAGSVTAVELSKKRSLINAYRNREYDNLKIMVGNFAEIEKSLEEKFSCITLIGVFEYAISYMGGRDPYRKMLECVYRHLKPGGRLILAIENKLGLKYWAGCTEDHLGTLFSGLEGYPDDAFVRTFSKKELSDLVGSVGRFHTTWYYPFPDYKFPLTVYSDRRLPNEGELTGPFENFDRERLSLFSEPKVYDSVIRAGLFPEFSNSFLAVCTRMGDPEEDPEAELPAYSKFSNERAKKFAARTDIVPLGSQMKIRKTALYPEGKAHIQRLPDLYNRLFRQYQKAPFLVNFCTSGDEEGTVYLEYLEAETLEERLDRLISSGKTEEAGQEFEFYLHQVEACHQDIPFEKTDAFTDVFGEVSLPEGLVSGTLTNLDMVCENLVMTPVPTVIDYEWTLECPVPAKFVLYRVILYFCGLADSQRPFSAVRYYDMFGIDESLQKCFGKMETAFQAWITRNHVPVRHMYESISPGVAALKYERAQMLQVFFLKDGAYTEENSVSFPIRDGRASCVVDIPEGCADVRVDPGNDPCMVSIVKIAFDRKEADLSGTVLPGGYLSARRAYFAQEDPNIAHIPVPQGAKKLEIRMTVTRSEKKVMEKMVQLEMENQRMKEQLRTIKESRIWKMVERTIKFNS